MTVTVESPEVDKLIVLFNMPVETERNRREAVAAASDLLDRPEVLERLLRAQELDARSDNLQLLLDDTRRERRDVFQQLKYDDLIPQAFLARAIGKTAMAVQQLLKATR